MLAKLWENYCLIQSQSIICKSERSKREGEVKGEREEEAGDVSSKGFRARGHAPLKRCRSLFPKLQITPNYFLSFALLPLSAASEPQSFSANFV